MKKIFLTSLFTIFTWPVTQALAGPCEKTLFKFLSFGTEIPTQVIGLSETCDDFGGNLAYSPKHHIYFYVNFNIPGEVHFEDLDQAYEKAHPTCPYGQRLQRIDIAIVDKEWISKVFHSTLEAALSWNRETLFISETVVHQNRLIELMGSYYESLNSICDSISLSSESYSTTQQKDY